MELLPTSNGLEQEDGSRGVVDSWQEDFCNKTRGGAFQAEYGLRNISVCVPGGKQT